MDKVRERIREYISKKVIKTEGIKELKREFKVPEDKLLNMWLVEKINMDNGNPRNRKVNKKKINPILRPLDLKKSNLNVTLINELNKCTEEDKEFAKGVLKNDIGNTIEEFWDSVQTKLNVMSMQGIPTDMIYENLDKHIKKMNKRGYVFKEN